MQLERSAFALVGLIAVAWTIPVSASTLDRVAQTGHLRLGYLADARPFTYGESGTPEGYAVPLCQKIADSVKTRLGLSQLAVDWVKVDFGSRLREVEQGRIDLLCTPTGETLERRQQVSYSKPVFPGGMRAVIRGDAPAALREALAETPSPRPVWRGAPAAKVLEGTSFAVVSGTTSESWLARRLATFQINARVVPVPDYRAGLQALRERKADVFFGDRAIVLGAMDKPSSENIVILDRRFTHEPLALALARNDDDFRLLVDRSLSEAFSAEDFGTLYGGCCGAFDEGTRAFFQWNTILQ
jgi:polar amino acid transport system substrate-binding protein